MSNFNCKPDTGLLSISATDNCRIYNSNEYCDPNKKYNSSCCEKQNACINECVLDKFKQQPKECRPGVTDPIDIYNTCSIQCQKN